MLVAHTAVLQRHTGTFPALSYWNVDKTCPRSW